MPKSRRGGAASPEGGGDAEAGGDSSDNNDVASQGNANSRHGTGLEEPPANNTQGPSSESRKRPRLRQNDPQSSSSNLSLSACDQCRIRKVRCDRQQPDCSNCRKAGTACNQTSNFKRVNHTKQLRNDFSSVLYRLDEIDETLGTLTQLTKQFAARPHPVPCSSLNPSRKHSNEALDAFPSPSNTPSSRQKSPALGNTWPSLFLPSSQHELGQTRLEMVGELTPISEDGFLTERVELEHGGQRTYKNPASMALLKSISRKIAGSCQVPDLEINGDRAGYSTAASTRAIMLHQLEMFPFQGKCLQPVVSSDRLPVVAPPQLITCLFIDGFLRNINVRIPIFDERSLRDAVDIYYSGRSHMPSSSSSTPSSGLPIREHPADNPWALIFTNIALLELDLETQVARWQGSRAGPSSISASLLTEDLISSFLRNCDRALADLTPYTRPNILNVQTLLTLALVAQQFYSNTLCEKVLQTACHVSRTLGLHLSKTHDRKFGESFSEGERIFRVLYGLDKQRVFLTGDPCDLYHFDSDLDLWKTKSGEVESPSRRLTAAMDDMMMIWEEVYLKLYSARAIAAGATYLSSQVAGLMQLLTRWSEHHPGVLETTASRSSLGESLFGSNIQHSLGGNEVDELVSLQLELRYCYYVTHVLILRCDRSKNERSQVQMRHHARTSLRLIVEMGSMEDSTLPTPNHFAKARLALLSRALGAYPMVAFMDLVAFHLDEILPSRTRPSSDTAHSESDDVESDIELFNSVLRLLQGLQNVDRPSTYLNRIRQGLEWATRVLEETKKAFLMGSQTGELSVPAGVSASTITSSLLGSSWPHLPSILQPHQQAQAPGSHQQHMTSTSSNGMYTPCSSELGVGNLGGMYDPTKGQSTVSFLDGMTEGGEGGGHMGRTTTTGCGFYGLENWQDFFTQGKSDLA